MIKGLRSTFLLIAVGAVAVASFALSRQSREGDRRTETLHRLISEGIERIEVYENEKDDRRLDGPEVNSDASKALFAEAMHGIIDYKPNRDQAGQRFYVRLFLKT